MFSASSLSPNVALGPDMVPAWQALVREAAQRGQSLQIQGGHSKAFYGHVHNQQATVLSTCAHHGVVSYEPTELVVTVRCGTPLAALEDMLASQGQCLAFEPPHFGQDTVGGMVAAGLSGPARASVGAVRDYVLGVQMINGKGELLVFGGQVMKNVAGYDLSRVMAGSLGQLGVITEVSLKVMPVPPADATLKFSLEQGPALAQLARWRGQPLPIHASCWVLDQGVPNLYVRLKGAVAAVRAAAQKMCAEAEGRNLSEEGMRAQVSQDWRACQDQTLPFFTQPPSPDMALWRLSVAPTSAVLNLPATASAPLIEWHGGLRWVWAPLSDEAALRQTARVAGGHATLMRAPAQGPAPSQRFEAASPAMAAIHQRLRDAFDPHHIWVART